MKQNLTPSKSFYLIIYETFLRTNIFFHQIFAWEYSPKIIEPTRYIEILIAAIFAPQNILVNIDVIKSEDVLKGCLKKVVCIIVNNNLGIFFLPMIYMLNFFEQSKNFNLECSHHKHNENNLLFSCLPLGTPFPWARAHKSVLASRCAIGNTKTANATRVPRTHCTFAFIQTNPGYNLRFFQLFSSQRYNPLESRLTWLTRKKIRAIKRKTQRRYRWLKNHV